MPELKITHGGKASGVSVDRVYKIRRGDEEKALADMRKDGADNIVFKGDNGDLYIASARSLPGKAEINDKVEVGQTSRVEFNGVKGVLMGFDNEKNGFFEVVKARSAWSALGLGGLGGAGLLFGALKFGVMLPAVANFGIIAGLGAIGFALGATLFRAKPNYDKLDKYSATPELA